MDTTPPTWAALSFPNATSATAVTVTFTATDAGSGVANTTCRFRPLALADGSAAGNASAGGANEWALCTSPQVYSGLAQGRYGLTLRAADKAGSIAQVRVARGLGPHGERAAVAAWHPARAKPPSAGRPVPTLAAVPHPIPHSPAASDP